MFAKIQISETDFEELDRKWDKFKETFQETDHSSERNWDGVYRVTKVIFAGILTLLVLGSAVTSKFAFFLLTANVFLPTNTTVDPLKTWQGGLKYHTQSLNGTLYDTDIPVTNVCYIWALCIFTISPYIKNIVYYSWKVANKENEKMNIKRLLVSLVLETIHTVGICFLVFVLLPSMDPITGVLYSCNITLWPAICLCVRHIKQCEKDKIQVLWYFAACFLSTGSVIFWGVFYMQTAEAIFVKIFSVLSPLMISFGWLTDYTQEQNVTTVSIDLDARVEGNITESTTQPPAHTGTGTTNENDSRSREHSTDTMPTTTVEITVQPAEQNENAPGPSRMTPQSKEEQPTATGRTRNTFSLQKSKENIRSAELGQARQQVLERLNSRTPETSRLTEAQMTTRERASETGSNMETENTLDAEQQEARQIPGPPQTDNTNEENGTVNQTTLQRVNQETTFLLINIFKTLLTFGMVLVIYSPRCNENYGCIGTLFGMKQNSTLISGLMRSTVLDASKDNTPFIIAVVGAISAYICYRCSITAVQTFLQVPGFALPMTLCTHVTWAVMLLITYFGTDTYKIFPLADSKLQVEWAMVVASIMSSLSLLLTTKHIIRKNPKGEHRVFYRVDLCSPLLDQSLMLNRIYRQQVKRKIYTPQNEEQRSTERTSMERTRMNNQPDATITREPNNDTHPATVTAKNTGEQNLPFVYLCATMWHEEEKEMKKLLKSILRLDKSQFLWKRASEGDIIEDFNNDFCFDIEGHIFFDDALNRTEDDNYEHNEFVKTFERVIREATGELHQQGRTVKPLKEKETPYGKQLIYELPYKHKLIVHLKDKTKIRAKKRWSQVMYLYYLLSFKADEDRRSIRGERVQKLDNIFILALDGDVDFQPKALYLLVERMKKKTDVGAACGRIHPIGSGWVVWYQKFEYAVSHWLQKAAEHVTGCVLCSPGCFSLFRGSALAEVNVAKRYTTVSSEPKHLVQYDQGEDRWLCTLILKQGKKVEYIAGSDAYTYAPEGFNAFFKQRKRWGPSTMANILDLLADQKVLLKNNKSISLFYIAYQVFLFVTSVLTPGTIFLMILGAINLAYPSLSLFASLGVNVTPVAVFVVICLRSSQKTQLRTATVLSIFYTLLMMVVIVGLIRQAVENGLCSVTTIFIIFVGGVFVLSGILHPKECGILVHGFMFFLAIPTMSMLLLIYSIVNLNDVSWGTRERTDQKMTAATTQGSVSKRGALSRIMDNVRCLCCQGDQTLHSRIDQIMIALERMELGQTTSGSIGNTRSRGESYRKPEGGKADVASRRSFEKISVAELEEETKFWIWLIRKYLSPSGPQQIIISPSNSIYIEDSRTVKEISWTRQAKRDSDQTEVKRPYSPLPKVDVIEVKTKEATKNEKQNKVNDFDDPIRRYSEQNKLKETLGDDPKVVKGDLRNTKGRQLSRLKQSKAKLDPEELETKNRSSWQKTGANENNEKENMKKELLKFRNKVVLAFLLLNALFVTVVFFLQKVNEDTKKTSDSKGAISVPLPCKGGESVEPIGLAFSAVFGLLLAIQFLCMLIHRLKTFIEIISTTDIRDKESVLVEKFDLESLDEQLDNTEETVARRSHVASERRVPSRENISFNNEETTDNASQARSIVLPARNAAEDFLSRLNARQRKKFLKDAKFKRRFGIEENPRTPPFRV